MTSRTIVCSDCGEAVPYGRLSCPSCGALLASVAGGARGVTAAAGASEPSLEPDPDDRLTDWATAPGPVAGSPSAELDPPVASGPGAYVPSTLRAAPPPATAGASAPDVIPLITTQTARPSTSAPGAAPAPTATSSVAGPRGAAPPAARPQAAIWLDRAVAVAGGLIALGLLLPWSSSVVGASGIASYVDRWGLAGPWHILVLVAAVVVAALAVVPTPFPAWSRSGLPALGLGAFVVGLVWPYLIGPLGGAIGSALVGIGGIVAVVGGLLVVWHGRHNLAGVSV